MKMSKILQKGARRFSLWRLVLSIIVDVIGAGSYLVPVLGEATDTVWAPVSMVLIQYMYRHPGISFIGFLEEASIGFDWVRTASIGWVYFTFID